MHESSIWGFSKREDHTSRYNRCLWLIDLTKYKTKRWLSQVAHTLAGCASVCFIENRLQFKRAHLPAECEEVFLHTLQEKAYKAKHYLEGSN